MKRMKRWVLVVTLAVLAGSCAVWAGEYNLAPKEILRTVIEQNQEKEFNYYPGGALRSTLDTYRSWRHGFPGDSNMGTWVWEKSFEPGFASEFKHKRIDVMFFGTIDPQGNPSGEPTAIYYQETYTNMQDVEHSIALWMYGRNEILTYWVPEVGDTLRVEHLKGQQWNVLKTYIRSLYFYVDLAAQTPPFTSTWVTLKGRGDRVGGAYNTVFCNNGNFLKTFKGEVGVQGFGGVDGELAVWKNVRLTGTGTK